MGELIALGGEEVTFLESDSRRFGTGRFDLFLSGETLALSVAPVATESLAASSSERSKLRVSGRLSVTMKAMIISSWFLQIGERWGRDLLVIETVSTETASTRFERQRSPNRQA